MTEHTHHHASPPEKSTHVASESLSSNESPTSPVSSTHDPNAILSLQRRRGNAYVRQVLSVQRQSRPRNNTAPQNVLAELMPGPRVEETPTGITIPLPRNRRVSVIGPVASDGVRRFSYQVVPPANLRGYSIIRIVAAPGVRIVYDNFPDASFLSLELPLVEVFRVQNVNRVPPQGQPILPDQFQGPVGSRQSSLGVGIQAVERGNGVDLVFAPDMRRGLRVMVNSRSPDDRFAYEIAYAPSDVLHRRPILRVVKTPDVVVTLLGLTHGEITRDFVWEVYQVPNAAQVPAQGTTLAPIGQRLTTLPAQTEFSPEDQLLQFAIGLLPVVGELVAIAEFAYGAYMGRALFGGQRLDQDQIELLGLSAAMSVVSLGMSAVQGATQLARMVNRQPQELTAMARALAELGPAERQQVENMARRLQRGQPLNAEQQQQAQAILRRVENRGEQPVQTASQTTRTTPDTPQSVASPSSNTPPAGGSTTPAAPANNTPPSPPGRRQPPPIPDRAARLVNVPEATVMQAPNPTSYVMHRRMYNQALNASPEREVVLYRNMTTGEYLLIQGTSGTVPIDERAFNALAGSGGGTWHMVRHSHPQPGRGEWIIASLFPSGAMGRESADFLVLYNAYIATNPTNRAGRRAVQSAIDVPMPDGSFRETRFGINPNSPNPWWVEVPRPDGPGRVRREFPSINDYHEYLNRNFNTGYPIFRPSEFQL
ncbi:MAG: hypothetical protein K8L91_09890 [Anaerolineae bacterium]|nr:hypothetical protein [Anaerolineae bacterium]